MDEIDNQIGELFSQWLESSGLSDRTIKEYLYYYEKFGGISKVEQENIDVFLERYNHSAPSRAFIQNLLEFVKIRKYLSSERIAEINIPRLRGRKKKKIPKFLSITQVQQIASEMEYIRDKLLLMVSFYAGTRISGLLNMRLKDFHWTSWRKGKPLKIKITEKGNKDRMVNIPSGVAETLLEWSIIEIEGKGLGENDFIWRNKVNNNPLSARSWQYILSRYSKKALGFKVNPHSIRHSTGTWMIDNNFPIQEVRDYLGHQDISTTQIYTHINPKKMQKRFDELFK